MHNEKTQGFNLIEILISLSIIIILSGITLPRYTHFITHQKELEAAQTLLKYAFEMEKYQIENQTYVGAQLSQTKNLKADYIFLIEMANDNDYVLAAKPIETQAKHSDACGTLLLNARGKRSITGNGHIKNCW